MTIVLAGSAYAQKITLDSPVFGTKGVMPKRHTVAGKDVSPPLVWGNIPSGAKELSLIFEDVQNARIHWLVYNIPATATGLREALPKVEIISQPAKLSGTIQGLTDFKNLGPGYHGPEAAASAGQRYRFTLYALNARLSLLPGLDKPSLMTLIRDHIVGEGELIVTLRR